MLFVGTSVARGSAAQRALAAQGVDMCFDIPRLPGKDITLPLGEHDVIAFDAPSGESGLLIVNGRTSMVSRRMRIADFDALPAAIAELLGDPDIRHHDRDDAAAKAIARNAAEPVHDLIAGLPGVVLRCGIGEGGRVTFVSPKALELCGHRASHFTGHGSERLLALVPAADRRRVMTALQRALRSGKPFSIEHRLHCANGAEKWLWHGGNVRRCGADGAQLESFVVDITERKSEEQQLAYLANHDALTGVANRSMFMEQLGKSARRADRHDEMIACLFLDLDRFKHINDTFGHAVGDDLLQQVSERLRRCVRGNDMIGRLGGDEFTVLLDGIAEPQDAAAAAKKILDELVRPYHIRGRRFTMSASIGISCYPGDANDAASLLRNADAAMYHVKSSGRRGYRFHSAEMSSRAFETLALANGLRNAIESDEISLRYQPRVDLRTGRVRALEVLARWNSVEFGDVEPSRFIALAEDVGLIGPLGDRVLRDACRQALAWDADGLPGVRISVNVSPKQFRDDSLDTRMLDILRETGLDAKRLELEITESTMMQDHVVAADVLQRLKRTGVSLSVDDFGTGYSSLHMLRKFPLDYLKVDRSFIRGVPGSADDVALTEAIIAMAKRLNLGVVAEGIETEAQGIFVRSSDCDEGQGNLFSPPVTDTEIRRYLRRRVH